MDYDTASKLSVEELTAILLTVDGKGKEAKRIALEELLQRKYEEGCREGEYSERMNSELS